MTIKTFIEKAIEGGWKIDGKMGEHFLQEDGVFNFDIDTQEETCFSSHLGLILLDPLAWQAVGKVEGWSGLPFNSHSGLKILGKYKPVWEYEMHRMIDALIEGKTIEDFIKTLC